MSLLRRWAAALALLILLPFAVPATAEPPMWRIKGDDGAEVVLFGSIHVLTPGLDWRSPALDAALDQADQVWFEIAADPAARAQGVAAAVSQGRLPQGRRLSQYLPPEGQALLEQTRARLGIPRDQLEPLRPWFAEVLISLADLHSKGGRQGLGVEEQLLARVPRGAAQRAFETPESQIAILADQPMDDQIRGLMKTLRELEDAPEAFNDLQRAWVAGDLGWIERETLAPMKAETPRLYRRLVVDRNHRWTAEIERLLKGSEQAFIVVGVGHLIGADGVPTLLRRRGVAVEGP